MFRIIKDNGAALAMTEVPNYIKLLENGCFTLCPEEEAAGIAYAGQAYHLEGRPDMEGLETVVLEKVDAGAEITAAKDVIDNNAVVTGQVAVAVKVYVRTATTIPDDAALQMKSLFQTWEEVLAAKKHLAGGTIINGGGTLYRVEGANGVDPMEHQPPYGEGMLAVYRPIDVTHAGTLEDPIPWVYGMDCAAGLYYAYGGGVRRCAADMPACVWAPGTVGMWQWEVAE